MKRAALGTLSARKGSGRAALYRKVRERNVAPMRGSDTSPDSPTQVHPVPGGIVLSSHHDLAMVAEDWLSFQLHAHGTLYQNFNWCRIWLETIGRQHGVNPVIVIGREDGQIRFLLPFQIARRQGIRVLEWLGSPYHNYGWPLLDPAFQSRAADWFRDGLSRMISAIDGIDAVALSENPGVLDTCENPLAAHFTARGANPSFALALNTDFESIHIRMRGGERRRSLRKKKSALEEQGQFHFGLADGKPALHAVLDTMFSHQEQRLAEIGVHSVFGQVERQFVHRLAEEQHEADPILAPYVLSLDGEVLAVMLGGLHGGTYWALISSLAPGPWRKFSPGDIALHHTIAACCARGLSRLDFSAGDSPYKRQWAEETIESSVILQALNLRGLVWAAAYALRLAIKRTIKRNPALLAAALFLRRKMFSRR